jgi:hypothetical protein
MRGRGDRGGAVPAARHHRPEVADAALRHLLTAGDDLQGLRVEPDPHLARDHRDRRGDRPLGPHDRLQLPRDLQVARPRQPVRDQRALQGDDRAAPLMGLGDLRSDVDAQRIARAITTRWISLVPS